MKKPGSCWWRRCTLKATEWDRRSGRPLCTFHGDCAAAEWLIEYLGAAIPVGTAPCQYRLLFFNRMKELTELSDEETWNLIRPIVWPCDVNHAARKRRAVQRSSGTGAR